MTLEKSSKENDRIFDLGSFKVLISEDLDGTYENLKIDYINNFFGKGFTISDGSACSSGCC